MCEKDIIRKKGRKKGPTNQFAEFVVVDALSGE